MCELPKQRTDVEQEEPLHGSGERFLSPEYILYRSQGED